MVPPDNADLQRRVLAAFQVEYREQLEVIRHMLENWPAAPGPALDDVFRMAHSMKGGARVCGLKEVENLAHSLESLLAELSRGKIEPSEDVRAQIERLADQVEDAMEPAAPAKEAAEEKGGPGNAKGGPAPTPAPAPTAIGGHGQDFLRVEAIHLEQMVQASGQLLTEAGQQDALEREMDGLYSTVETLRSQAASKRLGEDELRSILADLSKSLQQLRRTQQQRSRSIRVLGEQIQSDIRRICMVPISSVFEGFPKMMRDLAAEQGKRINFTTTGADSQADRSVLQTLRDPVMHALRNSMAHGIEKPSQRRAAGKPETGEVRLEFQVSGSELAIRISDDGRGLDIPQIRAQALAAGLANEAHVLGMHADDVTDFLFYPGFSTAAEVTTVAGRGVGLSVVKERVGQLQGTVRMVARPEGGTALEIHVPVTISTHRLLLVRSGGRTLALPARSIRSLLHVMEAQVVEGRSCVLFEGRPIPLTTASEATQASPTLVRNANGHLPVAVLQGERPLALNVEQFLGELDAVIRPLPPPAANTPHFSGGVILEDGSLALVLNAARLAQGFQGAVLAEKQAPAQPTKRKPSILVVDDSFTARTLQKSIFEASGYTVRTAVDGRAALNILHSEAVDAVVSDIQMPHLDGFGLLAEIKRHPRLADLPVVLVTSLAAKEDQERGLALGADAYIVKQRFDHRELLSTIRQLI